MQNLAMAVAIAVKNIEERDDEGSHDHDIRALEAVAACLTAATIAEQKSVAAALAQLGAPQLTEEMGLAAADCQVPELDEPPRSSIADCPRLPTCTDETRRPKIE